MQAGKREKNGEVQKLRDKDVRFFPRFQAWLAAKEAQNDQAPRYSIWEIKFICTVFFCLSVPAQPVGGFRAND